MDTRIYFLRFPKETSDQPIIYQMVKQYDIKFNIRKADILPQREGFMILELNGSRENVKAAMSYLKELGVRAERLAAKIGRDDESCFQCGQCTGVCPVEALYIQRPEMTVHLDIDKCTGCGICVDVCPVKAMKVSLDNQTETVSA